MKTMLAEFFRENMRRRRIELQLTQKDVASRLGVSAPTVTILEKGPKSPTLDTIERVAFALGCSPATLLVDPSISPPQKKISTR
jgi:transcriptional regulator with XRE-family HTH domain